MFIPSPGPQIWDLPQGHFFGSRGLEPRKVLQGRTNGETPKAKDLVAWLDDNKPDIRASARELLVDCRNKETVKLLVDLLVNSKSLVARMNAILVLGELGSFDKKLIETEGVENLLIKYLKEDPDIRIRSYAAEALGKIGSKDSVDPLTQSLKYRDPVVSRFVVQALGRIGDPRTTPSIVKCLRNNDPESSIENIDNSHEVSWYASCALGDMRHPEIIEQVVESLLVDDPIVKLYALELLNNKKNLGVIKDLTPIINCLSDKEEEPDTHKDPLIGLLNAEAIKLLGKTKDQRAVDPLIKFLTNKKSSLRLLAAQSLGMIGDPKVAENLINCLDTDDNTQVCLAVVDALREIKPLNISEPLINSFFNNNDIRVRFSILRLLNDLDVEIIPMLVKGLCHEDGFMVSRAEEALNGLRPDVQMGSLLQCLSNDDEAVRRKALELLEIQIDGLLQCLSNDDEAIKEKALEVLNDLGAEVVPMFVKRLCLEDKSMTACAEEALNSLKPQVQMGGLLQCLSSNDEAVKEKAREILLSKGFPARLLPS